MKSTLNPDSHATKTPTGDRADKHAISAEPQQTPASGDEAEQFGEEALAGTSLTPSDVHNQAAYRGTEADVGQQSATSKKAEGSSDTTVHEDRG